MKDSRIKGLDSMAIAERINEFGRRGWLSAVDVELLQQGRHVLLPAAADSVVENVVGTFSLPLAIAPNFIVNGRSYIVPLVIEEPSVVAALSNAARLALPGGFEAHCHEALLAGQVHLTGMVDPKAAAAAIAANRQGLVDEANAVHESLLRRGGGVRDIESRLLTLPDGKPVIAVHILVDTCDAMGANLVNTICETLAPQIATLCDGDVALRILSNLADRSMVTARVRYSTDALFVAGFEGERVRDRIVQASDIACVDIYRAATHNKGIMNGIDAFAIATGNDWRAIEAGAHAYAACSGRYAPLATWSIDSGGDLLGKLRIPLRVATAGGTLHANPAAQLALRMTGVESAEELAELMAAVGLAQNFAALRALATHGIQQGHMRLHARNAARPTAEPVSVAAPADAAGKVILCGEHAVVYGRHAIALPIHNAVAARIVGGNTDDPFHAAVLGIVLQELGIAADDIAVEVRSMLPPGMGLGSSAAIAVAVARACSRHFELGLGDAEINAIAFACEQQAHGTPSGIDNTIATYAVPMLFRNSEGMQMSEIALPEAPPLLVAFSKQRGSTRAQLAGVRHRYQRSPAQYDAIFDQMDALSLAAMSALQDGAFDELGSLMNICHGLLNAIEVSTAEIEAMVRIARSAGAAGAKLTGGGGGGAVVALCPTGIQHVGDALAAAGFATLPVATSAGQ